MRNFTPIIALLAIAGCTPVNRSPTQPIDAKRAAIDGGISGMQTQKVDVFGESTEGGEATAYKDATDAIRMIHVTHYGEIGKIARKLYFEQGDLIFAELVMHRYNMPIFFDEKKAKEMDMEGSETFDPAKTRIETYRYYFKEGQATEAIGPDNKPGSSGPYPDRDEGKFLIEMAGDLQAQFGNKTSR